MEKNNTEDKKDDLWVLLKLKEQLYAVNSSVVESIIQIEDKITKMPKSSDLVPGVIRLRGNIISIVNLRAFLGMGTLEEEQKEFDEMLEQRKQDHIRWVNELKRCLQEDDKFTLATDPHQCAFGKWYDNYHTDNQTVAFHLNKIDEPHKKLHETAHEAFDCLKQCESCEREECLQIVLKKETEVYMPKVVGLLEQAKTVFKDSYRKMCVVLSDGSTERGILVDSVVSVEKLTTFTETDSYVGSGEKSLVSQFSQRYHGGEQVLILNHEELLANI
ncbi:chemotaxis protein CheW [Lachnospiraceae bacterium LCP25S3_G4]